jgi:hypothetical protein
MPQFPRAEAARLGEHIMRRDRRDDEPHLVAATASFDTAKLAYQEAVANIRVGEVVRMRDAVGTLLLSTDGDE